MLIDNPSALLVVVTIAYTSQWKGHNVTIAAITGTFILLPYLLVKAPQNYPDSKVHGANMGPIWGRQDPGGPMLPPWTLISV